MLWGWAKTQTITYQRQLLEVELTKLTEGQRAKFNRCYPKGVPTEKLCDALDLCHRTNVTVNKQQ